MSNDSPLNSSPSSPDHTCDEDPLKKLKLQDSDLDRFASYFELAFQGNSRSIIVLVALLRRLCGVAKLRQEEQNGIWIEDIIGRLTHRLIYGVNQDSRLLLVSELRPATLRSIFSGKLFRLPASRMPRCLPSLNKP